MLSPKLDSLGVRPLEEADAPELHALFEANRDQPARCSREEAQLRETELVGGRYLDSVVYGLLGSEWGVGDAP